MLPKQQLEVEVKRNQRELYMLFHALTDMEIAEAPEYKHFTSEEINKLRKRIADELKSMRQRDATHGVKE